MILNKAFKRDRLIRNAMLAYAFCALGDVVGNLAGTSLESALQFAFPKTVQTVRADEGKQEEHRYKTDDFRKDAEDVLEARMLFGESRDCAPLEQIAIGYTAVRRANDGKKWNGETVKEAILAPSQYSAFNKSDPNRVKMMDPEKYDAKAFDQCLEISKGVLTKKYSDPTQGATHYHTLGVHPKWADSKKMVKIGRIEVGKDKDRKPIFSKHIFYREE